MVSPSPSTPSPSNKKRRENIQEKLQKARESSPSGTLGPSVGSAGVKGSYQATGGGTTSILATAGGDSEIISYSGSVAIHRAREAAKPTTGQQIQKSLLERQGYSVRMEGGNIVASRGGRKVLITKTGESIEAPSNALINPRSIPTRQEQRYAAFIAGRKGETSRKNIVRDYIFNPADATLEKMDKSFLAGNYERATGFFGTVDKGLRKVSEYLIPAKLETDLYGIADYYRRQAGGRPEQARIVYENGEPTLRYTPRQTLKESFMSFFETARTGKRTFVKSPPDQARINYENGVPTLRLYSSDMNKKSQETMMSKFYKEMTPATFEFAGGYMGGLRRKPLETGINTAIFFALPKVFNFTGKSYGAGSQIVKAGLTPEWAGYVTETEMLAAKTASVAIPAVYGGSVLYRASKTDRPFGTLGEITSTEIIPMMAGTYAGTAFWMRSDLYFQTMFAENIEKVAGYPIITPRARAGLLDYYAPKYHYKLFTEAKNPFTKPTMSMQEGDLLTGSFNVKYSSGKVKKVPYPSGMDLDRWVGKYGSEALTQMHKTPKFQNYVKAKQMEIDIKATNPQHVVFDLDATLVNIRGEARTGVRNLLGQLEKEGHTLSIWTHSPRNRAMDILKKNDLTKYFSNIVTREDYAMGLDMYTMKDISKIGGDILVDDSAQVIAKLNSKVGYKISGVKHGYGESETMDNLYRFINKNEKLSLLHHKDIVVLHAASGVKRTPITNILFWRGGIIDTETPYEHFKGLFVSPSDKAAAAFFGVKKSYIPEIYGGSLLMPYPEPTLVAIRPKGIRVRASYATRGYAMSGQRIRKFYGEDIPGIVDLPLTKREPEGVLTGKLEMLTWGDTGDIRYYVSVNGARIPIKEFKIIDNISKVPKASKASRYKPHYEEELSIEEMFKSKLLTPGSLLASSSNYKLSSVLSSTRSYYNMYKSSFSSRPSSRLSSYASSYSSYKSSYPSSPSSYSSKLSSLLSYKSSYLSKLSSYGSSRSSSYYRYSSMSSRSSSSISRPSTSYPPVPTLRLGNTSPSKSSGRFKRLSLFGRYTPSLEAVGEEIYGLKPARLTGLEIRPIIR